MSKVEMLFVMRPVLFFNLQDPAEESKMKAQDVSRGFKGFHLKFISLKIAGISLGFELGLELGLTMILVLIGSSSCSVYKSDGRKNLESVGPTYYQNKVTATAALVPAPLMNSYLIQHPDNIVYDLCEAQDTRYITEQSTEIKCSFKLSCIEITNLDSERHSSPEPIEPLDHRLLLSPDAQRIFQKDLICVAR